MAAAAADDDVGMLILGRGLGGVLRRDDTAAGDADAASRAKLALGGMSSDSRRSSEGVSGVLVLKPPGVPVELVTMLSAVGLMVSCGFSGSAASRALVSLLVLATPPPPPGSAKGLVVLLLLLLLLLVVMAAAGAGVDAATGTDAVRAA